MSSPTWPHSTITQVFENVFLVTGTNIVVHDGIQLQHSRNMIIVRNKDELSLINTVKLSEEGLAQLDSLGTVANIIRIGAFHGRDDAFYLNRYNAKLWALAKMIHADNHITDVILTPNQTLPFQNAKLFLFETSVHPEAAILLEQDGGILITCDSIKNWVKADKYFSQETAALYQAQGYLGEASISSIWLDACKVQNHDFANLLDLNFQHLLSAHGEPLINSAHKKVSDSIEKMN